jgi:hypothetical protein
VEDGVGEPHMVDEALQHLIGHSGGGDSPFEKRGLLGRLRVALGSN